MRLTLASTLSTAHTLFMLWWLKAEQVGQDALGNTYWRMPPKRGSKRERRWVAYAGEPEASMVPPEWHGWLHHQMAGPPESATARWRRPWQQPHQPNATGTAAAYLPAGHTLAGGRRAASKADYEAWVPED